MGSFRSILVDVDALDRAQPALERAALLARRSGARLTVVDLKGLPDHVRRYLPARLEEDMSARQRMALEQIAGRFKGQPVESKLLDGRGATPLLDEILAGGHDLVVREAARDLVAPRREPYGAVNTELLQGSACPVLLVGPGTAAAEPHIVAAVDTRAESDGGSPPALNMSIVRVAMLMAELEGGSVTLLHAWQTVAEGKLRGLEPMPGYADYMEAGRQRAADGLALFTQSLGEGLPPLRIELRHGEAEDVIPSFVVSDGIDLVVMGSVARRGISGFIIGNTAERIAGRLPCSLLVVKPEEPGTP